MERDHEFMRLLKENKGIVYKICNSYCSDKDDRNDLAQEIIYNLWKSFGNLIMRLNFQPGCIESL